MKTKSEAVDSVARTVTPIPANGFDDEIDDEGGDHDEDDFDDEDDLDLEEPDEEDEDDFDSGSVRGSQRGRTSGPRTGTDRRNR